MVRGNDMDGRGDLYSVGVVLFEMLAGRRPFQGSVKELMRAHTEQRPPRLADLGVTVPPALEAVVQKCLAKHADDRPAGAWEVALAYEKALGRRIITARAQAGGPGVRQSGLRPALAPENGAVPPADRNAVRQSFEASMPEAMAMVKLKGFIFDLGGEVIESVPGLIRVRLAERKAQPANASGLFRRLMAPADENGGRKTNLLQPPSSTDLELHMERPDPTQSSRLTITLVMRASGGMVTPEWRNRCNGISRDLQAYLMGR
jgi:serine/threonine-protein kinase